MTRARGLDLSSVQAEEPDFAKIKAGGFSYVILKCTQGATITDPTFRRRALAARAAGLLVGAYMFLTTTTPVDDQVARCITAVRDVAPELGVFVDFEYPPRGEWIAHGITGAELVGRALRACEGLEAAGIRVAAVYAYPDFAEGLPYGTPLLTLCAFGLWIASYHDEQHEPGPGDAPTVPPPWSSWKFWQWSGDKGLSAPGIRQVVDHDVFNGDEENLRAWVRGDDAPPTVPEVP